MLEYFQFVSSGVKFSLAVFLFCLNRRSIRKSFLCEQNFVLFECEIYLPCLHLSILYGYKNLKDSFAFDGFFNLTLGLIMTLVRSLPNSKYDQKIANLYRRKSFSFSAAKKACCTSIMLFWGKIAFIYYFFVKIKLLFF